MIHVKHIGEATLYLGDCIEVLPTLPTLDACITDPPYGLKFMGHRWDYNLPSVKHWAAVLERLKPGAHLLSFAGTRTQHRMACAIEDAGFEIRDLIAWIYGNGFPKSLDVSKAIDKAAGAERQCTRAGAVERNGYGDDWDTNSSTARPRFDEPATDAARQWNGWGTALKPALEPITLARKPLDGTVAETVQAFGTGALNVDACRVATSDSLGGGDTKAATTGSKGDGWDRPWMHDEAQREAHAAAVRSSVAKAEALGRFPANLIHDGSPEVLAQFPWAGSSGSTTGETSESRRRAVTTFRPKQGQTHGDQGSAARFFYCAKASTAERDEGNTHPTVKPLALMRYLCMLASAPGAVVLDPYLGSGTTGVACVELGRKFIGIERDPKYFEIACNRIEAAQRQQRLFA